MKAVRLIERGQPLKMQELPLPEVGDRDVLIRVKAAGICHSDAHYRAGTSLVHPLPRTLGHEVAGIVEECGSRDRGDRRRTEAQIGTREERRARHGCRVDVLGDPGAGQPKREKCGEEGGRSRTPEPAAGGGDHGAPYPGPGDSVPPGSAPRQWAPTGDAEGSSSAGAKRPWKKRR